MKANLAVCAAALLLTSCVVTSVHPYYRAADVIFEPSVLGQWTNTQQADERWTFEREGTNGYSLTYVSGNETNVVSGKLFKLEGQRFFDFMSAEQECRALPPPIPAHFLLRASQLSPTLRLAPLSHDWLKGLLDKNPRAVAHELLGAKADEQRVVLTTETEGLQRFLKRHLETEEAWKDSMELRRADGH